MKTLQFQAGELLRMVYPLRFQSQQAQQIMLLQGLIELYDSYKTLLLHLMMMVLFLQIPLDTHSCQLEHQWLVKPIGTQTKKLYH